MKKIFFLPLLVLLSFILFTSCSDKGNYLSALPESPILVYKANIANLLNDSEILADNQIRGFAKEGINRLSGDMRSVLRKMLDEPEESGISFSDPAYAVVENVKPLRGMLLFSVKDKSKLTSFVKAIVAEKGIREELVVSSNNGVSTVENRKGTPLVVFDDCKMIIAFSEGVTDAMEYMRDNSSIRSEKIDNFIAIDTDMAVYIDYSQVLRLLNSIDRSIGAMIQSDDNNNAALYCTLDFAPGKIIARSTIVGMDETIAQIRTMHSEPNGGLLKYIPECSYGVAQLNVKNMSKYIELFSTAELDAAIDKMNSAIARRNEDVNLDISLLNSISGDVVAAITPIVPGNDNMPQMALIAECSDSRLFETILSLIKLENEDLSVVADNVYALNNNKVVDWDNYVWGSGQYTYIRKGKDYYFGYEDNKIFIVPENFYEGELISQTSSFKDAPISRELTGAASAVFDVNNLLDDINRNNIPIRARSDRQALGLLRNIDNLVYTCSNDCVNTEFKVNFADVNTNALKQIKDLIISLVVAENIR